MAIGAACLTGLSFGFDIGTGNIINSDEFRKAIGCEFGGKEREALSVDEKRDTFPLTLTHSTS